MAGLADVEAACAICGAPPVPECPHESQRLEVALNQAMYRWSGFTKMREWVLDRARDTVLSSFDDMKRARYHAHVAYLQTLPCFTLYQKWRGQPPQLTQSQLQSLEAQIRAAREIYKVGVDDDWRRSCLTYPRVLDYFFDLIHIGLPDDRDEAVRDPDFGGPVRPPRRSRARRGSRGGSTDVSNGRRKKDRRRHSRGRTPIRR